jgi:predicted kinase
VEVSRIIAEIDAQISKLQQARELLSGTAVTTRKGPGRPKGSKNAKTAVHAPTTSTKRKLSPEGRKRIADAMKRRWAERRKLAAKAPAAAK